MSLPSKDPKTGWKPPRQRLIECGEALRPDLPPGQRLPYVRQVPISRHPVGKAGVQGLEGRNPPYLLGGIGGGKGLSHSHHRHTLQHGYEGIDSGIGKAQGPQPHLLGWADRVAISPLGAPPPMPHGWCGGIRVISPLPFP